MNLERVAELFFEGRYPYSPWGRVWNSERVFVIWNAYQEYKKTGRAGVLARFPVPRGYILTDETWLEAYDLKYHSVGDFVDGVFVLSYRRNVVPDWWCRSPEWSENTWINDILRDGATMDMQLSMHVVALAYRQGKLTWQLARVPTKGRPVDMGGPRDMWIGQGPWDSV